MNAPISNYAIIERRGGHGYDRTKPHAPGNTYWAMPRKNSVPRKLPQNIKDKCVSQNKFLLEIRQAKTRDEMLRRMIAAKKAGQTNVWIGIAAGLTPERVRQIF
jgi:hypothetical protein